MMNFTMIENDVMDKDISDGAYQSNYFGDKTTCFPSEEALSSRMKKSIITIQIYTDELVQVKLIKKKRRGSISNLYEILRKTVENKVEKLKERAKDNLSAKKGAPSSYDNKKPKSIFNDYHERNYNITNLEAMLLGRDGVTYEDCLINK